MNEENIEGTSSSSSGGLSTGVSYEEALAYQETLKRMPSTNNWVDPETLELEKNKLDRKLVLFGTDLTQIPCFRNSFLYGILSGFGSGITSYAFTSKARLSQSVGFYSFVGITFIYYCYCNWEISTTKFRYKQIEYAMKQHSIYQGTDKSMTRMLEAGLLDKDGKED